MPSYDELNAMSQEERDTHWRKRQVVARAMQVENSRRELSVQEAHAENPDLMPEYHFAKAKELLNAGFTPEMISAVVDEPVESIHTANQVYGFINQTASERGQAVLDRFKEEGYDTDGFMAKPHRHNGGGYHF